jgi:hypothetical protein
MMSTWVHELPLWLMAFVIFGAIFLVSAAIHFVTGRLAAGRYGRSFKAISPGLLSPLGIIFGLFIAFTASQVWNDTARATVAVATEASALRSVVVMSAVLPEGAQTELRRMVRDYIQYTATTEWPLVAKGVVTLNVSPPTLNDALKFTLSLPVVTPGQQTAQSEVAASLQHALEVVMPGVPGGVPAVRHRVRSLRRPADICGGNRSVFGGTRHNLFAHPLPRSALYRSNRADAGAAVAGDA